MSIPTGTYRLGPGNGTLSVRTGRVGAAAKAGHDLLLHVTVWQATLEIGEEIGSVLARLVQGSGREEISSPIGIVRGSSSALERGFETYFWVLGLISAPTAPLGSPPSPPRCSK